MRRDLPTTIQTDSNFCSERAFSSFDEAFSAENWAAVVRASARRTARRAVANARTGRSSRSNDGTRRVFATLNCALAALLLLQLAQAPLLSAFGDLLERQAAASVAAVEAFDSNEN